MPENTKWHGEIARGFKADVQGTKGAGMTRENRLYIIDGRTSIKYI
jgi:hypothetical protein